MLKICECWGGEVTFFLESVSTVLIDFFYSCFLGGDIWFGNLITGLLHHNLNEFTIYDCLNLQFEYAVCAFYICGCVPTPSPTLGIRCQRPEHSFGLKNTALRIFVECINYRRPKTCSF